MKVYSKCGNKKGELFTFKYRERWFCDDCLRKKTEDYKNPNKVF